MDVCGKFEEHKRSVRIPLGAADSNSCFVSTHNSISKCTHNSIYAQLQASTNCCMTQQTQFVHDIIIACYLKTENDNYRSE